MDSARRRRRHGVRSGLAIVLMSLAAGGGWSLAAGGRWSPAAPPTLVVTLTPASVPGARPRAVQLTLAVPVGWHIAAGQPGTSGLPTRVTWQLPSGWRVGAVRWPPPTRKVDGLDTLYTHAGRVVVAARLNAAPGAATGPIQATIRYGLCRNVCIPGRVTAVLAR